MKLALFTALTLAVGCSSDLELGPDEAATDAPDESARSDDERVRFAPAIPPDLTLPTGNELTFLPVPGADGEIAGHLIVERVPLGVRSSLELAVDLDAGELFAALAEPGAPLPASLGRGSRATGGLRADFLAGAAAPQAVALASDLACDNASFNGWSWVPGGAVGSDSFIRNDKVPATYDAFTSYCYNPYADGHCHGDRYEYRAWWNTDGEWVGKLCGRAVGESSHWAHGNDYVGPRLSFQRFIDGAWSTLTYSGGYASWAVPANATHLYYYHYIGAPEELAVRIYDAYAYDQFDIMMNR